MKVRNNTGTCDILPIAFICKKKEGKKRQKIVNYVSNNTYYWKCSIHCLITLYVSETKFNIDGHESSW